ncbi:hypothetical protein FACS1894159_10730 [Bacteroidia bacterium]|nr:hypothetical protein FACS1894159_10730 [Bacteroidia bacterium]
MAAALIFAAALQAQPQGPRPAGARAGSERKVQKSPEEIARAQSDHMKVALQLKDDQAGKLYNVLLRYANISKDASEQAGKQREAAAKQMEGKKGEIEATLTPAQKAAWEAIHRQPGGEGRGHGHKPHMGQGAPGADRGMAMHGEHHRDNPMVSGEMMARMRSEKMKTLLQLNADQTKKIGDIELKYFNIAKANHEAAIKMMQDNALKMSSKKGEIEALLTPAQKEALAQMGEMERERAMHRSRAFQGRGHAQGAPCPTGR